MRITHRLLLKPQRVTGLMLVIAVLGVVGCAGNQPPNTAHQYLDSSTGITLTGLQEPVIFHHEEPRLAAHVRDYLYVGPVEMNRMGKYSYYLWLGEWSSIDRLPRSVAADSADMSFEEVVILLDGLPMELHNNLASGDKSRIIKHPYSAPVDSMRSVYMRVSRDQLNKIAAAKSIVIRVGAADQVRSYKLWHGNTQSFGSITKTLTAVESQQLAEMSD
jgi:hypothetical protein